MRRFLSRFINWLAGDWWDVVPSGIGGWCIRHRTTGQMEFYHSGFDRQQAARAADARNSDF